MVQKDVDVKMGKIRLIISSNENGNEEEVYFTSDFDSPADDFCRPGLQVTCDEEIEDNLPAIFPREYTLVRR